ncbi:MAG: class I SAM-dependent methyltransferase [Coleofasciculaceae cyanobacterium]
MIATTGNQPLCSLIAKRIAAAPNQRITFAEYMDLVLYHPEQGYYATGAVNIGAGGDFVTAPNLARDFGELLAEQFVQVWHILGQPRPFTLVEIGAGQGLLAADILTHLHRNYPDCLAALEYLIVEKAQGLITQQQQLLQKLKLPNPVKLHWCSWQEIAEKSIVGCCFSNELVDAFPVHQFVLEEGELREVYVTTASAEENEIKFVEVIGNISTPQLRDYFDFVGIDLFSGAYPEGYRSEVNLAAFNWLETVASKLKRGFLFTIDYGYTAERYYLSTRHHGTLQCYYRHRYHDDPYIYIGEQDLTAHVNFTAVERQGELCGLSRVGFTQQGLFLMALGLGDRLSQLSSAGDTLATGKDVMRIMQRRQALHDLINPLGLGGFGVLVQSKGLTLQERQVEIKGLSVPTGLSTTR